MGDDATYLLVLDKELKLSDSIPLISYADDRLPKELKPDLEASTLFRIDNTSVLMLIGSGSFEGRNKGIKYEIVSGDSSSFSLEQLFVQLKQSGVEELNIEGACNIKDKLVLANRGHKTYPFNHLIITDESLWNKPNGFHLKIIEILAPDNSSSYNGISGLCYSEKYDQLIMTISTEDTRSSYEDGTIGKSYLWIINRISEKMNNSRISPERVIDLETTDLLFKGQKIESAAIIGESDSRYKLALVADNDDGSSKLFIMEIKRL